ncbi:hypothetical protein [Rufibacter immobilis]|uniref:hypothetical protein n=1 Tax=Rufibacter immobilis TaxID=1348778 RepID=UPI0035E98414
MAQVTLRGELLKALVNGHITYCEFFEQAHVIGLDISRLWEDEIQTVKSFNRRYFQNEEENRLTGFTENELKRYVVLLIKCIPVNYHHLLYVVSE